jgi:hypothetical protein
MSDTASHADDLRAKLKGTEDAFMAQYRDFLALKKEVADKSDEITRLRAKVADARNKALEEAAKAYEDFMSVAGPSSLDDRLCCDGRECSCYGATERDQLLYYGRAAIRSLIQEGE